ncbi:hypothetical protein [Bacteroides sp.]|uniref:hypothetical protein n=1 Tax=Bacteroides sp. TaxID=29523 RepID=UPI0025C1149B|nr:hypothetical protein [Bacteroides sp.]
METKMYEHNIYSFMFCFFLSILLWSFVSDNGHRLEETLVFAGENRAELEKVLLHYQDDSLKLEAARFLLIHMKDRHSYRGAGIDSVRQALIETSRQQGFMEHGRRDKWRGFSYAGSPKRKYRYLWVCPPVGKRLNMAEVAIYADSSCNRKLDCQAETCAPPVYNLKEYSIDKAFDGQNLTRYESGKKDVPCMLDLKMPTKVGGIIYVPRNDDNYVSPGDYYELFYQNGTKGWNSLGAKVAEFDYLEYDHVPAGALLWLHNRTKGVEEQVFCWKEGKQVFNYRLK